ncbi:MAG TPA: HD domain-containing protein [Anaerolineaceae bacterium]|nr:HD domain-containing protein [Anaerolineaceae bacterium]
MIGASFLPFPEIFNQLRDILRASGPVYLVGGAVRDILLGRPTHDLDFVLYGDVRFVAKNVADTLSASLYVLDNERNTYRVINYQNDGSRLLLDFAALRAGDLEHDLRGRDFTINAIALDPFSPDTLIDPLDGELDLKRHRLKACSSYSFIDDPARILRGVRLAMDLKFEIQPATFAEMKKSAGSLNSVAAERKRDELFKMLDGNNLDVAMRMLDQLGALPATLPELAELKGVAQSPPHIFDVWEHTLSVIPELNCLFSIIVDGNQAEDYISNPIWNLAQQKLGQFQNRFKEHFSNWLNPERSRFSLLALSALYHDIAKPATSSLDTNGRIRFFEHEMIGARIAAFRGRELALSQIEIEYLVTTVRHHMRPHFLENATNGITRRAIYHFFKDTGEVGVDICLLSLADVLATYGPAISEEHWIFKLEICQTLLSAWWDKPGDLVRPVRLLTGDDLQSYFGLKPGRLIGELLEALREAQACGEITNHSAAIKFVQSWLETDGTMSVKG